MNNKQFNVKGDLKKRDGYWLAKLRYRGWHITNKRFPDKDSARQWLHEKMNEFMGSSIQDDIDRFKTLIEETYGPTQGDNPDE
jgi:hypothetical protein